MNRATQLRQLLERYDIQSPEERSHHQAMLELLSHSEDPFSRHQLNPGHFTASAFVLSPDQRQTLLILHAKLGKWLQPGGHIDPDDPDVLAAARRELQEETGLVDLELAPQFPGLFHIDIHTIPARPTEGDHAHYDLRFLFVAPTLDYHADSDALDAQWVSLERLGLLESDDSVHRAIARIHVNSGEPHGQHL